MIERVQLLKLKAEHATPEGRADVVEHALALLSGLPGVLGVRAGVPADADASKSWDVFIALRFADEFVTARVDVQKAWSFETRDATS